jgi:hypothetical protein
LLLNIEYAGRVVNYLHLGDRDHGSEKDGGFEFVVPPVSESRPGAPIFQGRTGGFPRDRGHAPTVTQRVSC